MSPLLDPTAQALYRLLDETPLQNERLLIPWRTPSRTVLSFFYLPERDGNPRGMFHALRKDHPDLGYTFTEEGLLLWGRKGEGARRTFTFREYPEDFAAERKAWRETQEAAAFRKGLKNLL